MERKDPTKVSVVIPTLNEAKHLPHCLQSLRSHGAHSIHEILVVDAGSADGTVAIAEAAGAIVLAKRNSTIAGQRNAGVEVAASELIAFLDADCTIEAGWAENAIRHFRDPAVVSVGAPPNIPDGDTTWVQKAWCFLKRKPNAVQRDVSWLASANVWVRKSSFEQVGGFDETFETCEDADLGFRLKDLGRIISDPRIRVQHHREPRTLSDFYKKEVWHGKNSYDGVINGRITPAELPSLITPILFVGSVMVVLVGILCWNAGGLWAVLGGIAGIALAPAVYTLRAVIRKGNWLRFPQFLLVYFVYFAARADALVRWMMRGIFGWFRLRTT